MRSKKSLSTPFAKLLPPLSEEEFEALKASIKADGVWNPILVDEDGNVLDGHHRLKIDPDAPRKVVPGLKTDAEKKAFVFQSNNARRNLTPVQKQKQAAEQREVALALRKQDPKKFTLQVVAGKLGVSPSTVSRWIDKGGTNLHVQKGTTPRPDARRKVPEVDRTTIADRVKKGESKKKIAKDLGVTRRTVSKIAEKDAGTDSRAPSKDRKELKFLQQRVKEYVVAGQEPSATRLKQELNQARKGGRGRDVVPLAALYRREKELPPPTPFDQVILAVQAQLDSLKLCDRLSKKIERLVPGLIDVVKNEKSARLMTGRFTKALKELEKKSAQHRAKLADDSDDEDLDDDGDGTSEEEDDVESADEEDNEDEDAGDDEE